MHPLDLVKTRLQLGKSHYSGLHNVIQQTYTNEGVRGFYKGILPPILAETPKRAAKFFTFEQYRLVFKSDKMPVWMVSFNNPSTFHILAFRLFLLPVCVLG